MTSSAHPALDASAEHSVKDPRVQLFALWIAVMFNYLYADILGLMDAKMLAGYLAGEVDGLVMDERLLFSAGVLMQLPSAMVLISRIAPRRFGRWANLGAGVFSIVVAFSVLTIGENTSYYLFYTGVEVVMLAAIVVIAWRWREKTAEAQVRAADVAPVAA